LKQFRNAIDFDFDVDDREERREDALLAPPNFQFLD